MAQDYRFYVVCPGRAADAALGALADALAVDDRTRLLAALPWQAANARVTSWQGSPIWERAGILALARREQDGSDAFCFQLKIAVGGSIEAYERGRCVQLPREQDAALIACWISVWSGARLFVISATPVADEHRPLCQASTEFALRWRQLASDAHALALFLDADASLPRELLYPEQRQVSRPTCADFELSDGCFATDAYWSDALQRAGVSLPAGL